MLNLYHYFNKPVLDNHELYCELIDECEALTYSEPVDIPSNYFDNIKHLIKRDPQLTLDYVKQVYGKRWLEAEPELMKSPEHAVQYACDVIGGVWPEAEPYIMKDPGWAYVYACDVIEGRWIDAEQYIITDLYEAVFYAKYVIKGRWLELEPTLSESIPCLYTSYCKHFKLDITNA